jgi:hypothetical protein
MVTTRQMKKKLAYAGVGIALLVIVSCLASVYFGSQDPVSPRNFQRIQLGMTEGEVELILGRFADQQYHPWDQFPRLNPVPGADIEWEMVWIGQYEVIVVHFDSEGKVCNKGFAPRHEGEEGFFARIRRSFSPS